MIRGVYIPSLVGLALVVIVLKGKDEQVLMRRESTGVGIRLDLDGHGPGNGRRGCQGLFARPLAEFRGMLDGNGFSQFRLLVIVVERKGSTRCGTGVHHNADRFIGLDLDHFGTVTTVSSRVSNQRREKKGGEQAVGNSISSRFVQDSTHRR